MIQQEIAASDTSMLVEACSNTSSKIINSDAALDAPAQAKKKKKRKSLGKDPTSNDLDNAKCASLINNSSSPLENDSVQQPVLMADSELMQHDAELRLCENNCGGRDNPTTIDTDNTREINLNSISKDQAGANNVSKGSRHKKIPRTLTRRRNRALRRTAQSSKEGADSAVEVVEKGRQTTLSNGSGGAISPGCVKNTLERESGAGHVTSVNVEEDKLVGMHLDGCSDIKHASGDSMNGTEMDNSEDIKDGFAMDLSLPDLSGEDFKQVKRAKLNVDHNVLCDVHSADALPEESTRLCKGQIASDDPSSQDSLNEPLDQKRQSKINDSSSSPVKLDEMKDNVTPNANKELLQSSIGITLTGSFRRKLLVLDLNGLLADVVPHVPDKNKYKDYKIIGMKAVFKRPFCDDFLQFCFERFDVGVWSSRTKKNVKMIIDFLMGKSSSNLLFCWDQSHCTMTGFNTLENRQKPLVLKELRKLWEKHERDLPWESGDYNESNTLMLDDSPYKALRNPPNTAIFPKSYQYKDKEDNSLGPGGDLRVYLEGLALAEDVQKYVEQNPYGQRPITKSNPSWRFYAKVIGPNSFKEDHAHSEIEHASMDNNIRVAIEESKQATKEDGFMKEMSLAESFEQSNQVKFNIHKNEECNMSYAEQQIEGCRRFCKGKIGSDDTCGKVPPTEPLEQKRQSMMKDPIPLSSEVDASNWNAAQVSNKEIHPPQMPHSSLGRDLSVSSKRKLLVLDVNGLLADIVSSVPGGYKADRILGERKVFKRPFCDDFLQFCFERFRVGFWLTTTKRNVLSNLEFLLGRTMRNLLFFWDISHCFETGFSTVENRDKPIILKELRRLWEKHDPNLPWERGDFDASNTLLLDNNPSTALLNPPHSAIFPPRYRFKDEKDNSLGPGGDLRVYLEGLALAENVQNYVKHNPFGERPITEKNLSWNYYLKVIGRASSQLEDARLASTERWWNNC